MKKANHADEDDASPVTIYAPTDESPQRGEYRRVHVRFDCTGTMVSMSGLRQQILASLVDGCDAEIVDQHALPDESRHGSQANVVVVVWRARRALWLVLLEFAAIVLCFLYMFRLASASVAAAESLWPWS